jgi:RNA polymerase sigma factor (sigma-70 family)
MNKETHMDDHELLQEYVECRSEKAFAELVARHINLVYSTALRMVQDAALAKDVAQLVFIQLARKAPIIRSGQALPGWLYRVTRCQAANAVRDDHTRRQHETEAMNMIQTDAESSRAWESMAPHLESAMNTLSAADQNAVVLRFFQGRSWREVAGALALREDAAQKRVSRAVEKLRSYFVRRGIGISTTLIVSVIAANAVQAAPAGLALTVATASLAGAGGVGSFSLISTLTKTILMKKTSLIVAAVILTAAIVSVSAVKTKHARADAPVTAASLREGLVLDMSFDQDETGNGMIMDSSGKKNNGRALGVRWTADGKKGGAYEFTTDGDEIVVSNNKSLNPKQLTLAAWIKTSNADAIWRRIFDKSFREGYALSISGGKQNKWRGLASMETGPGNHFSSTKSMVADGQWHQVVATFDGTEQLLFVDGKLEGKAVRWAKPGRVGATDFNLAIGCNRSNLGEHDFGTSFRGLIDEPMMWNRALSTNEVAFLFESQK